IRESQKMQPLRFHLSLSLCIFQKIIVMNISINFNNQTYFVAIKIYYIIQNWHLSMKFHTQGFSSNFFPHHYFCRSLIFTKLPSDHFKMAIVWYDFVCHIIKIIKTSFTAYQKTSHPTSLQREELVWKFN